MRTRTLIATRDTRPIFSFVPSGFRILVYFFKVIFIPLSGAVSMMADLAEMFHLIKHRKKQCKTRFLTSLVSLALNTTYTIGAILNFLNPVGLAAMTWSSVAALFYRDSYIAHQSKPVTSPQQINPRDEYFKKKCNVAYRTMEFISNGLLFAGLFCFPVGIAGTILLGITKLLEYYDKKNDYSFCRKISGCWNWLTGKKPAGTLCEDAPKKKILPALNLSTRSKTIPYQKTHAPAKNINDKGLSLSPFVKELVRQRRLGMYQRIESKNAEEKNVCRQRNFKI